MPTIVLAQKTVVATVRIRVKSGFTVLLPNPTSPLSLSGDQILGFLPGRGMKKESFHSTFWDLESSIQPPRVMVMASLPSILSLQLE